jgi:predicted RNA-binding protein YlxR (DUF448 family)
MLATAQDSELDRGTHSPGSERHCALTRELKPVDEMIRFVVGPAGEVVPDVKRKLPGRGIWITASRAAVEEAVRRNVFPRGFKREVAVGPRLAEDTERLLERSALDALAIAGKAGQVAAGTAKVEAALARDELAALIHAADAGADGRRKLDAGLEREMRGKPREIAIIDIFTGGQLDLALNRPNVVHAAVLAGPGAATFLARAERLKRFRHLPAATTANASMDGARGQSSE